MDFVLSEEQELLRRSASRFMSANYDFATRRHRIARWGGFDPDVWRDLAELGLLGAALPEEVGGTDGGPMETMLIMETLGEALATEPYLETAVIGGGVLRRVGGPRARDLLGKIVAGEARIALAALEISARFNLQSVATQARQTGDAWIINGQKPVVPGAPCATHLLVTARTSGGRDDPEGVSLFLVETDAPGLRSHPYPLIDDRPAADLIFEGVRVGEDARLAAEGQAMEILDQVIDEATTAVCAEAVGVMRRLLEATIEYTKQRKQFGQPLAAFQVLQHRMVDMYMALEQSVSAVHFAILNLGAEPAARRKAVSAAKVTIGRSARMVAQSAVQLHGAMGMTDELAVGHYFKRATVIEQTFGSVDLHLARYAANAEPA